MKIMKRFRQLFQRNNSHHEHLKTTKAESKEIISPPFRPYTAQHQDADCSARRNLIDNTPYNAEPYNGNEVSNKSYFKSTQYSAIEGGDYPASLNPFSDDAQYPDTLNPFSDAEDWYPDELDPFRDDDINIENQDPEINVQVNGSEENIENTNNQNILQEFAPSIIINNKIEEKSPEVLNKAIRTLSSPSPSSDKIVDKDKTVNKDKTVKTDKTVNTDKTVKTNFMDLDLDIDKIVDKDKTVNTDKTVRTDKTVNTDKTVKTEFMDLDLSTPDHRKNSANDYGDQEKYKFENNSSEIIFEDRVTLLPDREKYEVSTSASSLNIANTEVNAREIYKYKNSSDVQYSKNQVENVNCSPPIIKDVENVFEPPVTDSSQLESNYDPHLPPSVEKETDDTKDNCMITKALEINDIEEPVQYKKQKT